MVDQKVQVVDSSATARNRRAWVVALVVAFGVGFWLLRAYLGVIVLALLLAYLFHPMKQWLEKKTKRAGLAVALTTVISILIVGVPTLLIIIIAVAQTLQFAQDLNADQIIANSSSETLTVQLQSVLNEVNRIIESVAGISSAVSVDGFIGFTQDKLPALLEAVTRGVLNVVRGVPTFITQLILYLFVFVEVLANGPKLIEGIKRLSPFEADVNELYFSRTGAMAKAMVRGQMLIALAQGVASAGVIALLGFGQYFWFMAVLFTFMSFIPLGAGIITIPLGILFIAFGDITGGLVILLNHFVVVTNIDNYIRPKVVPKDAQLSPALTMLSAFAGVGYFGLLGVIYGPIIMILITTTIGAYLEHTEPSTTC